MSDAKKISSFRYIGLLLSIATIISGIICFSYNFDESLNYFSSGMAVYCFYTLLIIDIIFAFVSLIIIPKQNPSYSFSPASSKNLAAIIPAIGSLIYVLLLLYAKILSNTYVNYILIGLSALTVLYYLCNSILSDVKPAAFATLSLFPIILLILNVAESYFDYNLEMNSPVKIIFQFSMLFSMFFTFSETRFALSKPMPRLYFASAFLASLLCGVSSTSYVILYLTGRFSNKLYLALSIFLFSLFIYTLYSMLCFASQKPSSANDKILIDDTQDQIIPSGSGFNSEAPVSDDSESQNSDTDAKSEETTEEVITANTESEETSTDTTDKGA